MNNMGGNAVSTLAEAQVTSEYFKKIQVKRDITKIIVDRIRNKEYDTIILTGHAGDGKTSILVQVLAELGMLKDQQPLEEATHYDKDGLSLFAVKDMSELSENKQIEYCREALTSYKKGIASIIISNTGPLIKCIQDVYKNDCKERGEYFNQSKLGNLQNEVLDRLDRSTLEPLEIGLYKAIIINIARIDNVGFVKNIIPKLIKKELWQACGSCAKCDKCPIFNNVKMLRRFETRVMDFITAYFRYMYENDKRMTIRQMLSQISYALTGNLTCNKVQIVREEENKFKYFFANLFFGYKGLEKVRAASQITGIRNISNLKIDSISLRACLKSCKILHKCV